VWHALTQYHKALVVLPKQPQFYELRIDWIQLIRGSIPFFRRFRAVCSSDRLTSLADNEPTPIFSAVCYPAKGEQSRECVGRSEAQGAFWPEMTLAFRRLLASTKRAMSSGLRSRSMSNR
jgi:hypothetical protein